MPTRTTKPRPTLPTTSSSIATDALETRWTRARKVYFALVDVSVLPLLESDLADDSFLSVDLVLASDLDSELEESLVSVEFLLPPRLP